MVARINDGTKYADRMMWGMWRDFFQPSRSWRMKTPIGPLAFHTKKAALMAKKLYEDSAARNSK